MNKLMTALLISATCGGSAIAGNVVEPVVLATAIAAPALQDDWGGFYVGGMASFDAGVWDTYQLDQLTIVDTIDAMMFGGFAGFNIQRGALVFGGEIAYSTGNANWDNGQGNGVFTQSFIDAKARAGYAMGNVLVYAVGGGSFASINSGGDTMRGFNYGAGAQMKFDNGMFVGIEYLMRSLTGVYTPDPDWTYDYNESSIAGRVGWQF